jgi:hypothetical protein
MGCKNQTTYTVVLWTVPWWTCRMCRSHTEHCSMLLGLGFLIRGLAEEAIRDEKLLWKLRPKCHKFLNCKNMVWVLQWQASLMWEPSPLLVPLVAPRLDHVCLDMAPVVNPLRVTCYVDEDAVGRVKVLAVKSHPNRLGFQVLERYSAYVCSRWFRQLTEWSETS